ncbi:MAG: hypothetical protein KF884_03605 [Fimbriimonadaceae bacterium]|nr:hypothetical protein [Fimbriimonadaceae bacterium]QYK59176.1 MAG: hypothetical protein KF884_03605 [Fimbriimonadaceae bacterium]
MTLGLFCAVALAATGDTFDLGDRPRGVHPVRLALTPLLDGRLEDEEWEPLSSTDEARTFFQWEPGSLYWAVRAPLGQDVVVSVDESGDGWLVGSDGWEFRIAYADNKPVLSARRLDATEPEGPAWVPVSVPPEALRMAVGIEGEDWILESQWIPFEPVAPAAGRKMGVRIDTVPTGSDLGPAYLPRALSFVSLQMDQGRNLPIGFSWRPEYMVRSVPVEDRFKVRFRFVREGEVRFDQIEYRPEGLAAKEMTAGRLPFPEWNQKGQASNVYESAISGSARPGYRILRSTLTHNGAATELRSSFRIAELVDFDVNLPKSLPLSPEARIIRGSVDVRSNGMKRVDGKFSFSVHPDWTVTRGRQTDFSIYHSRGVRKVPLEIIVPKDTMGVFPLMFQAVIGDKTVSRTIYLPVGQP